MSIGTVMSQNSLGENHRLPVGRTTAAAGRNLTPRGTQKRVRSFPNCNVYTDGGPAVNAAKESNAGAPPPVISAPPQRELERKLKLNPDDQDAKADVGSDESMDASDPPAAAQPGSCDDPAPSSGFPE
jgi:hypothetical protein